MILCLSVCFKIYGQINEQTTIHKKCCYVRKEKSWKPKDLCYAKIQFSAFEYTLRHLLFYFEILTKSKRKNTTQIKVGV